MNVTNVTPLSTTAPLPVALVASIGTGTTAARTDHVHVDNEIFDGIQQAFRDGRKLLGEFAAQGVTAYNTTNSLWSSVVGTGMMYGATTQPYTVSITGNEAYLNAMYRTINTHAGIGSLNAGAATAWRTVTAPNKSPRMLLRYYPTDPNGFCDHVSAGFLAVTDGSAPTSTSNGAYLRNAGAGNLFFVTAQGGVETTTDLGVAPTVLTSYEIESDDAGVTWRCRNDTTATVVATHITNVPTASTGCAYGIDASASGTFGSDQQAFHVSYIRVEGSFTP